MNKKCMLAVQAWMRWQEQGGGGSQPGRCASRMKCEKNIKADDSS